MSEPPRSGTSGLTALSEGLAIAWTVMLANKVRSLLTILGVAVGVLLRAAASEAPASPRRGGATAPRGFARA